MVRKILITFLIELQCHLFTYTHLDNIPVTIVIHGGAGTLQKNDFYTERQYQNLIKAKEKVIMEELPAIGGSGGIIGIDKK